VGAAPDLAGCYYSRALALTALGRKKEAIADYNQSIALDAHLACAFLNRGMLHYQELRYDEALADLARALTAGMNADTVHYNMALVYLGRQDPASALRHVELALQENPRHQEATRLREKLRGK
jgi:tetratricopeptide (TPR) repeat protein